MDRHLLKLLILSFVSIGFVDATSDYVIFQGFIVPLQNSVITIPMYWWVILFIPMTITCFVISYLSNSIKSLFAFAASGTLATHIYNHFASILHVPGQSKSWALENSYIFWSIGFLIQFSFYLSLMLIGYVTFKLYAKIKLST